MRFFILISLLYLAQFGACGLLDDLNQALGGLLSNPGIQTYTDDAAQPISDESLSSLDSLLTSVMSRFGIDPANLSADISQLNPELLKVPTLDQLSKLGIGLLDKLPDVSLNGKDLLGGLSPSESDSTNLLEKSLERFQIALIEIIKTASKYSKSTIEVDPVQLVQESKIAWEQLSAQSIAQLLQVRFGTSSSHFLTNEVFRSKQLNTEVGEKGLTSNIFLEYLLDADLNSTDHDNLVAHGDLELLQTYYNQWYAFGRHHNFTDIYMFALQGYSLVRPIIERTYLRSIVSQAKNEMTCDATGQSKVVSALVEDLAYAERIRCAPILSKHYYNRINNILFGIFKSSMAVGSQKYQCAEIVETHFCQIITAAYYDKKCKFCSLVAALIHKEPQKQCSCRMAIVENIPLEDAFDKCLSDASSTCY